MGKRNKLSFKRLTVSVLRVALATFVVWHIGIALMFGGLLITSLHTEGGVFSGSWINDEPAILFWGTSWTLALCLIFLKLTGKLRGFSSKVFRRTFWVYICLGVLIGYGMSIGLEISNEKNAQANTCNLQKYADTAISGAVFPIITDSGTGSAFAVNTSGDLVTAYHVVEGAKSVEINFAAGKIPVTVLRTAPDYDLALLKISQPTPEFLPLSEIYRPSEQVYAVGWPRNTFTAGQASISTGIISRIIKGSDIELEYEGVPGNIEILQSDTAINPGNSGGPLVGACGAIGVVTAISDSEQLGEYGFVSEQGIGYSVSAKTTKAVLGL